MREKLIKLIREAKDEYPAVPTINCCKAEFANFLADRLLANGVIVPPCKVGDTVYFIGHVSDSIPDFIYDDTITKIGVITRGIIQEKGIDFADIGKKVFLTREAAEQALKGEHHAEIH